MKNPCNISAVKFPNSADWSLWSPQKPSEKKRVLWHCESDEEEEETESGSRAERSTVSTPDSVPCNPFFEEVLRDSYSVVSCSQRLFLFAKARQQLASRVHASFSVSKSSNPLEILTNLQFFLGLLAKSSKICLQELMQQSSYLNVNSFSAALSPSLFDHKLHVVILESHISQQIVHHCCSTLLLSDFTSISKDAERWVEEEEGMDGTGFSVQQPRRWKAPSMHPSQLPAKSDGDTQDAPFM